MDPSDTVDDIRILLQEKEGLPPSSQRLFILGKVIEPEDDANITLPDINDGCEGLCMVYMILRLRERDRTEKM